MVKTDGLTRTIGVNFEKNGEATIKVWAPLAESLALKRGDQTFPLQKSQCGYWEGHNSALKPGDRYQFVLDGEKELPDPASLSQPDGVHGASAAVNLSGFRWTDQSWQSIPLEQFIIYELHTGTFSPEGTFEGIEKKLDHLLDLGHDRSAAGKAHRQNAGQTGGGDSHSKDQYAGGFHQAFPKESKYSFRRIGSNWCNYS